MRDRPAPHPSRLLSMGSHPCLPRPSVYGSLEQTALSMKLVLDVCFLVEKVSLRVFVTVSTLSRFLSDAIDGSSLAHPVGRSNKNALVMNSSHNFSSFSSERARFSAVLISLSF